MALLNNEAIRLQNLTAEEAAREWRNSELYRTDPIVAIQDHSLRDSFLAYRVLLRDWPASTDFPETRPTRT